MKPRPTILAWTFYAAAAAVMIILGLYASDAKATTYSAEDASGNKVTLLEEPCSATFDWLKVWHKAAMLYQGKEYAACWRLVGPYVFVLDSAGDISPIRQDVFAKDKEI